MTEQELAARVRRAVILKQLVNTTEAVLHKAEEEGYEGDE